MRRASALVLGLLLATGAPASATRLELDSPPVQSLLGLERPLMAVARAGTRLVVAGRMGGIYWSEDDGRRWTQAQVPLSVDFTAMQFIDAQRGWVTGHDGVVLATEDGGRSWQRRLDGRQAAALMQQAYTPSSASEDPWVQTAVEETSRFVAEDGARPFLDLAFLDAQRGYVVGAWGLIFRTDDGGRSWQPWMHRTDNPGALHLNAIRQIGDELWIVGERGLMLRHEAASDRFVAVESPYTGSYFGIAGSGDTRLAFGLEGKVFRSTDGGRSWQSAAVDSQGAITAGEIGSDGLAVLGDASGKLWVSRDGAPFEPLAAASAMPFYGLQRLPANRLALVGMNGVRVQDLRLPGP